MANRSWLKNLMMPPRNGEYKYVECSPESIEEAMRMIEHPAERPEGRFPYDLNEEEESEGES